MAQRKKSEAKKNTWDILKLFSDKTRLRILHLLRRSELSVGEMQEILAMEQSRISTQLAKIGGALLLQRSEGKKNFYSIREDITAETKTLLDATLRATAADADVQNDETNRAQIIEKRTSAAQEYFDAIARSGADAYVPGRSDGGVIEMLVALLPPLVIADLGSGRGFISLRLAPAAKKIFCIDNSKETISEGKKFMQRHGVENVEFILSDIQQVKLPDASADVALLSQSLHHASSPANALAEALRILKPGGKIIILDLNKHGYEKARELYSDRWLGFPETQIRVWLEELGFKNVRVQILPAENRKLKFQPLFACGEKA